MHADLTQEVEMKQNEADEAVERGRGKKAKNREGTRDLMSVIWNAKVGKKRKHR